jgi:hypothetical protein
MTDKILNKKIIFEGMELDTKIWLETTPGIIDIKFK